MKENAIDFRKITKEIKERKARQDQNKINNIPYCLPRLSKVLPGIIPEHFATLTTISGGGKSLLSNSLYVQGPYDYWKKYGAIKDFDISVALYALEDSTELTHKRMVIKALYEKFGNGVNMYKLNGYMEGDGLDDKTMEQIESLDKYFEEYYSKVRIVDSPTNPTGIYNNMRDWLLKPENGCIADENGNELSPEQVKEYNKNFKPTFYKKTNPNRIDIMVIDTINNITPEEGMTKWQAIDKLCQIYLRKKLVNFFKVSVLAIIQQSKEKERSIWTSGGDMIQEKHVPSLDSISEYKLIDTCSHLVLAIYDPSRYGAEEYAPDGYNAYNIKRLDAYYRNVKILKSNFAQVGLNTSLFFNGSQGIIEELPKASEAYELEVYYQRAEALQRLNLGVKPLKI